ncbi:MAG: hypothetical protein ACYSYV_04320 [Planctomycetota bacterium]|jgi:hypothetical protein
MIAIKQMILASVVSVAVLFGGCKDTDNSPVEPDDQDKPVRDSPPPQERSAPAPVLVIDLLHQGQPIEEYTSVQPVFSLNNRDTSEKGIRPKVEYREGHHVIQELAPGNYVLFVSINANPENPGRYPGYPGDFFCRDSRLSIPPDGGVQLDIELQQVIHLTLPQDNAGLMERWGEKGQSMIAFETPVEFAWDAIGEGAMYHYFVYRMQSEPFKYLERDVVRKTTQATHVSLNLTPSSNNEFYLFRLYATRGPVRIADLVVHGQRGYGQDFRFRVE